jgi:hypothetical protein
MGDYSSTGFFAGLAWLDRAPLFRAAAPAPIVAEVTSNHIRSMLADHLLDVPSSDQHTLKLWFAAKNEYSPPVANVHTECFIGWRLRC